MKNILLVLPLLFIVAGPLNAIELEDLDLKDAEISVAGDDSFITGRKSGYDSNLNTEIILFFGGFLSWDELNNNTYFTSGNDLSHYVAGRFNDSKYFAKFVSRNITKSDVNHKNDSRQGYYWVSQEGAKASCLWSTGEWGVGAIGEGGNNRITVSVCRPGKKKPLEEFLHRLMSRVEIDGGAINKLKASGSYNAPRKQATQTMEFNRELNSSELKILFSDSTVKFTTPKGIKVTLTLNSGGSARALAVSPQRKFRREGRWWIKEPNIHCIKWVNGKRNICRQIRIVEKREEGFSTNVRGMTWTIKKDN